MTRIWYDCEFLENGQTIDLISIGMVREDGAEYYAVNSGIDQWAPTGDEKLHKAISQHDWLMANVIPHLPLTGAPSRVGNSWVWSLDRGSILVKPRWVIANEVREFTRCAHPQLRAWYGAYDHVVLMQMWGQMIRKPDHLPMWTYDLKQECERLGNPQVPKQEAGEHNALDDARHNRVIDEFLAEFARTAA